MPFISLVLDMGDEVVEQHACPGEPLGVGKGGHGAAGQEDATACKQGKCGMMSNVAPFIISINLDDCINIIMGIYHCTLALAPTAASALIPSSSNSSWSAFSAASNCALDAPFIEVLAALNFFLYSR